MNTGTANPNPVNTDAAGVHAARPNDVGADLYPVVQPGAPAMMRDKTHWGPVWAGLLTALASFLVVEMFLYWVGALTVSTTFGGVTGGPSNGWISAIIGIVAFFLGGWIASRASTIRRQGAGAFNGLIVWSLGVVLILAFSALQTGMAFGSVSDAFARLMVHNTGASINGTVGLTRDAAGWGCLFLVLSAIAATFGGMIGERAIANTTDVTVR